MCPGCLDTLRCGVRIAEKAVAVVNARRITAQQAIQAANRALDNHNLATAARLELVVENAIENAEAAQAIAEFSVVVNDRLMRYADDCIQCALTQTHPPVLA